MTRTPRSIDAYFTSIRVVRRMVVPLVGLLLSLPSTAHAGQSPLHARLRWSTPCTLPSRITRGTRFPNRGHQSRHETEEEQGT